MSRVPLGFVGPPGHQSAMSHDIGIRQCGLTLCTSECDRGRVFCQQVAHADRQPMRRISGMNEIKEKHLGRGWYALRPEPKLL